MGKTIRIFYEFICSRFALIFLLLFVSRQKVKFFLKFQNSYTKLFVGEAQHKSLRNTNNGTPSLFFSSCIELPNAQECDRACQSLGGGHGAMKVK